MSPVGPQTHLQWFPSCWIIQCMSQEHSVALHTFTLHNLYNSTQPMMIIFLEVGRYRIPILLKLPLSLAKSWFCWPSWTITVVGKRRKSLRLSTIGFVKSYWWTWILSLPYFPSSWNYTVLSLFTKIKPSKDISVSKYHFCTYVMSIIRDLQTEDFSEEYVQRMKVGLCEIILSYIVIVG